MEHEIMEFLQMKRAEKEWNELILCNEKTQNFGLTLSEEEAKELMLCRDASLKKYSRVEFGKGILDRLVFAFCDSQYISQDNYAETLMRLQDIFYEFKNETQDKLSDDELMNFMREQFEEICFGDLDYLEETCLTRFGAEVRAGYRGFVESAGHGEYEKLSQEQRWDSNLYMEVVKDLF